MTFETMKMQLQQTIGIRAKVLYLLDLIAEILLELRDFTVFHKITFGEAIFFCITVGRALWYLTYGVSNGGNFDYYLSERSWIVIFVGCVLVHLVSFFLNNVRYRCLIILIYAFIWAFLTYLAILSRTSAPAVPMFSVFTVANVYLAVRIWHEK